MQATALKVGFAYSYVYNYTDHLGNIRLSYAQDPENPNVLKIIEESHYYPFGLKHANYNSDQLAFREKDPGPGLMLMAAAAAVDPVPQFVYNYKYNGKEFQDEMGLNWYDYGARNYDPAIGRWMNIDPLAEVSKRWTPYNYCYNNPIINVDPDGMKAERSQTANVYYDWDEGGYRTQAGDVSTEEEALSSSNWMPLTADTFNSYVKEKYNVPDKQMGDFAGKLFEDAFIKFGEINFEEDANFEGVTGRSTLSRPDAYSDALHFNLSKLRLVRYNKSVWWEVKARNKNVTLDKQIKGFIDGIYEEFKNSATKTGAAHLCLVTTSNSSVSAEVYVYAQAKGVQIQHWVSQYRMIDGSMQVDFGYRTGPINPLVYEFKKPVKL
ncbi:RHS repeat-associated core domain-containing protein [Flavobacterium sp. WW92]|uniref:RHS repeat domain-containing protein n=1 Tax=unclassified Flavobacterium TaxID=196869 RepID=UPI0022252F5B|nr:MULTISPECIES: RHS repeat-associated core domain-containing protein [unclassified Flavobacterium]WDO13617.1 RHS repeat-associated core domain-containing protein [Flavobacterium sp. WW92]